MPVCWICFLKRRSALSSDSFCRTWTWAILDFPPSVTATGAARERAEKNSGPGIIAILTDPYEPVQQHEKDRVIIPAGLPGVKISPVASRAGGPPGRGGAGDRPTGRR